MSEETLVSCHQMGPVVGEPLRNRAQIRTEAHRAAEQGARVVVFPELAACGYSFIDEAEVRAAAEAVDGGLIAEWQVFSAELGIVLVAGYAEAGADGKLYNSAVIIDPTGLRANYRKAHLWGKEAEYFSAGDDPPPVVETTAGRIAVVICYDLDFPEYVRTVALSGAQLLCAPVNWPFFPYPTTGMPTEMIRSQASAGINRMAIAVCDRVGDDRGHRWLGGTQIVNADGYPVTEPLIGATGSVLAGIDTAHSDLKSVGPHNHVINDRRPELYRAITEERT